MPQFRERVRIHRLATLLLLGTLLSLVPHPALAGNGPASVTGTIKDSQGVVQLGALVQVLTEHSITVATAFTDQHGHYTFANLPAGRYIVRASQTLFVPSTRGNLQLQAGASAVVNLTLSALFDTASWLPAERRQANEPDDDWKWTLRSNANRPILRILQDGQILEVSSSAAETRHQTAITRVRATVSSGDGGFGEGGVHNIVALRRGSEDGSEAMLRADLGSAQLPNGYGTSQELQAGYAQRLGYDGAARTVVTYKFHPELIGAGLTNGITVLAVSTAQRANLGDLVEVEAGGTLESVRTSAVALAAHPFLRLSTHVGGGWTIRYRLATDRTVEGFDDVTVGRSEVPVALVRNGHLTLEQGSHNEASVSHVAGQGTFEAVYFHDQIGEATISGGGASAPIQPNSSSHPTLLSTPGSTPEIAFANPGMILDPTTGTFRTLAAGYHASGARVTVTAPITPGLWIAAEYSAGTALASTSGPQATYAESLASLKPHTGQAATLAVKGKLIATQTQLRASYRWQPAQLVTAIDPYSAFADQAFLSCSIRQPIHMSEHLPQGLAATIDVTNLLAEGYRPFLSADGQTLYFAQAPRTIQAGLSFTF